MNDEQKITIDGKEYNVSDLDDTMKNQLMSLRACEQELARLQTQVAITQTARQAYAAAVKKGLEGVSEAS
jgi:uncharacterized protein (DUF3084 family)